MLVKRVQQAYRKLYIKRMEGNECKEDSYYRGSAVVFSPHPDDETLGCGGTIIRKADAGARIAVIFMTRGESSHHQLMGKEKMGTIREKEALNACGELGVKKEDIVFLPFRSSGTWSGSQLRTKDERAVELILPILKEFDPRHVFLPYPVGEHPDHVATNLIVKNALRKLEDPVETYEYPIWFWNHWPWVSIPDRISKFPGLLKRSLEFPLRFIVDLSFSVSIEGIIERKREALAQHASQMEAPEGKSQWHTLNDISQGEFLEAFFQEFEVFGKSST